MFLQKYKFAATPVAPGYLKFTWATWFWLPVAWLGYQELSRLHKICVKIAVLATGTCAQAVWFYTKLARPGYQTRVLKSYTDCACHCSLQVNWNLNFRNNQLLLYFLAHLVMSLCNHALSVVCRCRWRRHHHRRLCTALPVTGLIVEASYLTNICAMPLVYAHEILSQCDVYFLNGSHFSKFLYLALLSTCLNLEPLY